MVGQGIVARVVKARVGKGEYANGRDSGRGWVGDGSLRLGRGGDGIVW